MTSAEEDFYMWPAFKFPVNMLSKWKPDNTSFTCFFLRGISVAYKGMPCFPQVASLQSWMDQACQLKHDMCQGLLIFVPQGRRLRFDDLHFWEISDEAWKYCSLRRRLIAGYHYCANWFQGFLSTFEKASGVRFKTTIWTRSQIKRLQYGFLFSSSSIAEHNRYTNLPPPPLYGFCATDITHFLLFMVLST